MHTVNGSIQGRFTRGNNVRIGSIALTSVAIVVGFRGGDPNEALLGQGALSRMEMSVKGDVMTLILPK